MLQRDFLSEAPSLLLDCFIPKCRPGKRLWTHHLSVIEHVALIIVTVARMIAAEAVDSWVGGCSADD